MNDFEKLLEKEKSTVRRFVFYRLQNRADAEDVLQEIFLSAYTKFSLLKKESSLKHGYWKLRGINAMTITAKKHCKTKFLLMKLPINYCWTVNGVLAMIFCQRNHE